MNSKLAKKLRKQAQLEAGHLPMVDYKHDMRTIKTKDGKTKQVGGTRTLYNCIRKRYKELKKEFKRLDK